MIMFGWLFLWYLTTDFTFIALYPSAMWNPVPVLDLVGLTMQPSLLTIQVLKIIWLTSLAMACVGLFTRYAIAVAFVIGFYMLGAMHSFYKVNHSDAGLLLAMFVLSFSRCGDAFSIDAIRQAARHRGQFRFAPSGEYSWPLHMIRLVWATIFFLAGVAKLRQSGFEWMFTDNMMNLILRKQVNWEPPTELGLFFVKYPWTCVAMSAGAVVIEIAAPLVLISRIARLLIVPSMLGMQIGIRLIMGDDFTQFMSIYLFFVPWALVGAWTLRSVPAKPSVEVLYDGNCGLCGKTVAVLRRIDLFGRLRFRDVVADWQAIQADHKQLDRDAVLMDMHVVSHAGQVSVGYEAYRRIARSVPLGWLCLPLLYLPGVSYIGRRVYRRVADHRMSGGHCTI